MTVNAAELLLPCVQSLAGKERTYKMKAPIYTYYCLF